MARRWLVVLLLLLAHACASQPYIPDKPHPTFEQLLKLGDEAIATRVQKSEPFRNNERQLDLRVWPAIILEGGATWVSCYVPQEVGPGRIRFGLEGHAMSGPMPIEQIENRRLIERVACGTWQASCQIWPIEGKARTLTRPLLVKGSCNDDGG